jgi:hypothetical protein
MRCQEAREGENESNGYLVFEDFGTQLGRGWAKGRFPKEVVDTASHCSYGNLK